MKKSKSSVPLFEATFELGPAPPVRYDGLFATAGRPEPEPPPPGPPGPPFVAIAVGKTKEGESLPAKPEENRQLSWELLSCVTIPSFENPVPLGCNSQYKEDCHRKQCSLVHDDSRGLGSHCCSTTHSQAVSGASNSLEKARRGVLKSILYLETMVWTARVL